MDQPIDMEPPAPQPDEPAAPAPDGARYSDFIADAETWEESGHDEALLYRGKDLRRIEHDRWHRWRGEPERFPPPGPAALSFLDAARALAADRTRRRTFATLGGLTVLVLVFAGLTVHANLRLGTERDERLAADLIEASGEQLLLDGRVAQHLAAAAWRLDPGDASWTALANSIHNPATGLVVSPHQDRPHRIAASPDGSVIATGGYDGSVALWDLESGAPRLLDGRLAFEPESLEFSPDGRYLAASDFNNELLVWEVATGQARAVAAPNRTDYLAFDPTGTFLAAGGDDSVVSVWRLDIMAKTGIYPTAQPITDLAFDHTGAFVLAAGGDDGTLQGLDVLSGEQAFTVAPHPDLGGFGPLARIGYGTSRYLSCSWGCTVHRDPWTEAATQWSLPGASEPADAAMRGDIVVASHPSGGLGIWEAATGRLNGVLPYASTIHDVALSPDGTIVYAAVENGLQRWDLERMRDVNYLYGGMQVDDLAITGDGERLVSTGFGGTQVWDLDDRGRPAAEYPERISLDITAAPTGSLVATSLDADNAVIEIWDADSGEVQLTIEDSGAPVTSMGFNGDGSLLVAGTSIQWHRVHELRYGVTVWDTATGEPRARLAWDPGVSVTSTDISPDGSMVATLDPAGAVQLWDTADGALLGTLPSAGGMPWEVQFSPDGTLLAANTGNGTAFWDMQALGELPVLLDNGYTTSELAFDPGDRYFAVLETYPDFEREYELTESRIAVWDYEHGAFAASLPLSDSWYAMAITPDSSTLYAADDTGIAYYDLSYLEGDLHALACEQADYELADLDWEIHLPGTEPGSIEICP